ncbi:MAG: hypothetical protein KGJ86_12300 [Chloroflexota bacterium]|nr:hypothetical protein [Chloroflexota bacterium]
MSTASPISTEEARDGRAIDWPVSGLPTDVVELLTQPLDRKLIRRRKSGGRLIAYVEGHQAINQANRIFGPANWGAELVGPVAYRPMAATHPEREPSPVGMYSATVRVQVRGCLPKSDAGSGFALDDSPDSHDTALKTAVTDAMKRSLRHFGEAFGNGLYERRSNPVRISGARELADLRSAVLTLGTQLDLDAAATRRHVAQKVGQPFAQLAAADLAGVVRAMAEALAKRQRAA